MNSLSGKYVFQQQTQSQVFFLIDCDDKYGIVGIEQLLGELETTLHEGEPFGVTIGVGAVDVIVVIFPVAGTGVIGWVNIYAVHFACISKGQGFKSMVVFAVNDYLIGLIATALDTPSLFETSINRLVIFSNRHDIVDGNGAGLAFVFVI